MLYSFLTSLVDTFSFLNVFKYITFRIGLSVVTSLTIIFLIGNPLIRYFSKKKPDVLIMECMAVNPQYQWISEHEIVQSTLGVITNVRPDHLDEMGTTNQEIAYSLSNTIPFGSKVITAEKQNFNYDCVKL